MKTYFSYSTTLGEEPNLFVIGESVKLDMETNPDQPEIIKLNLPEIVFVDRCDNGNQSAMGPISKLYIPIGSSIDLTNPNVITIMPPQNWAYVIKTTENGVPITLMNRDGAASVSCDCTEAETGISGACHPRVGNQGEFQCVMSGGCNKCEKEVTSILLDQDGNQNELKAKTGSGFINLNIAIELKTGTNPMPSFFGAMFDVLEVKSAMDIFVNTIYENRILPTIIEDQVTGKRTAPNGHAFVLVNVYGRVISLLVPTDYILEGVNSAQSVECSCDDGSCKMVSDGYWTVCNASDCDGKCTLTVTGIDPHPFDENTTNYQF